MFTVPRPERLVRKCARRGRGAGYQRPLHSGHGGSSRARGGQRTVRQMAALGETESQRGFIPLPESAACGVTKQVGIQAVTCWSFVLNCHTAQPPCGRGTVGLCSEGCHRSLKEGLSEDGEVRRAGVPPDGSRRPLPASTAVLAVPVNLLLTEEAIDVGSEVRSQKTMPLSLLALPYACSGGEGLRHAGHRPRATSLCRQVLATAVEMLGSRF